METRRKCRRSLGRIREQWRGHVAAQAPSGVPGAGYCRRHGFHAKGFCRWRRVFGVGTAAAVDAVSSDAKAPRRMFAEVRVREAAKHRVDISSES